MVIDRMDDCLPPPGRNDQDYSFKPRICCKTPGFSPKLRDIWYV